MKQTKQCLDNCLITRRCGVLRPNRSGTQIISAHVSTNPALPPYVVYRHFMKWVVTLDKDTKAKGWSRASLKFAEPFAKNAGLENSELDIILSESQALESDLSAQDVKVSVLISAYRAQVKAAATAGKSLPPSRYSRNAANQERYDCSPLRPSSK
jgi:pantoate kinase